jgi:hypothetical protein
MRRIPILVQLFEPGLDQRLGLGPMPVVEDLVVDTRQAVAFQEFRTHGGPQGLRAVWINHGVSPRFQQEYGAVQFVAQGKDLGPALVQGGAEGRGGPSMAEGIDLVPLNDDWIRTDLALVTVKVDGSVRHEPSQDSG